MESEILKIASTQGIWAALSVALIFYILRAQEQRDTKQEEREKNYQNLLANLSSQFSIVEDIKKDVTEIRISVAKWKTVKFKISNQGSVYNYSQVSL